MVPFRSCFAGSGKFLLLQWWTHSEQAHIVLARNENSLESVVKNILYRHPGADIKSFLEIEIVAPPKKAVSLAAEYDRKEAISQFGLTMINNMKEFLESNPNAILPFPFSACKKYEREMAEEGDCVEEWEEKTHYNCCNCREGIIVSMSEEELYDKYATRWYEKHPRPSARKLMQESRAEIPRDNEPLWFARLDAGHHRGGVELDEVNFEKADPDWRPNYLSDNVLFFFRLIRKRDMKPIQERFETAFLTERDRKRKSLDLFINKQEEKRKRELQEVISFFSEKQ